MVTLHPMSDPAVVYPDSDGKPMADNTLQFEWIVVIKEGLEALFADNPDVFVAGDLLWYPVKGNNRLRVAPDAMVVFGRPKGYRGSYRQWDEDGIAPQVVFEVLSPGNRAGEMAMKAGLYSQYGVEEYYIYDPDHQVFDALVRSVITGLLEAVPLPETGFTSPRLGIRFDLSSGDLIIYRPDGEPFKTYTALFAERNTAVRERDAAQAERALAQAERDTAQAERDQALAQAESERQEKERLLARLRERGIAVE